MGATISNFRCSIDYGMRGAEFAMVDVTTGVLWWKRRIATQIAKTSVRWFFVATGEFTPKSVIENLKLIEARA